MVYFLTNLLSFDIPLLYYYINLRPSIIFCPFSGDIYLSLDISLSFLLLANFRLFYGEVFETFVVLTAILLPFMSPVVSAVLWITIFEVVLSELINMIKKFLVIFSTQVFTYVFTNTFTYILAKNKNPYPFITNILSLGWAE